MSVTTSKAILKVHGTKHTHQADSAFGPLGKVASHLRQIFVIVLSIQHHQSQLGYGMSLQSRMHRAHNDAIGKMADVRAERERREEMGVVRVRLSFIIVG